METRFPFRDSVDLGISVPDFKSHKTDSRLYSQTLSCGGYLWRLLVFPNGNRVPDVLSVYLDFVGRDNAGTDTKPSTDASSSSTVSSAQASDAPLQTPSQQEADVPPSSRPPPLSPGSPTLVARDEAPTSPPAEYAHVVEARVWFSVVTPPPSPVSLEDDSSGVISSANESECGVETAAAIEGGAKCDEDVGGASQDVVLKDCSHRFTSPDNDWGFRELIPSERARRYLDSNGCLSLKANVVVFGQIYTSVRDRIMASCTVQKVNWLDVIPLIQEHEELAATAPTRVGISTHNDGASLLHAACKAGSLSYASLLVARGASLDVEDDSGRTPLFYAARSGAIDVVIWLVEQHHVAVNARDSENRSALFYACEEGKLDVVQYLIDMDADHKTADYDGDTAARLAEGRGHVDVAALLRSLS